MTSRTILGIPFRVHSPSLLELIAHDDGADISIVTVAFDGIRWYLNVLMKRGHMITRGPFKRRDDAIELLASRRAA